MAHGFAVIQAEFDIGVTDIDGKQHVKGSPNQTMCCTLVAYSFSREAIMKGSPYKALSVTLTSVSVRLSTNASIVGVRLALRRLRQPDADGIRPHPKIKPEIFS